MIGAQLLAVMGGDPHRLDADDLAGALGALLVQAGFQVRVVLARHASHGDFFGHVFVEARRPGAKEWTSFDPHEGTAYIERLEVER
ncbi:MAG: hypothetical protein ACHREM_24435 [Polyangiales bacterium]